MTTISIDSLAETIASVFGIDTLDAARQVVQVHVDQIADDADLYVPEACALTEAGALIVAEAIRHSYAGGFVATTATALLERIAVKEEKRRLAAMEAQNYAEERDDLIRAALRTELRRTDIAAAAGVSEARLYQIRDGRR
jgi:hypothetical protein